MSEIPQLLRYTDDALLNVHILLSLLIATAIQRILEVSDSWDIPTCISPHATLQKPAKLRVTTCRILAAMAELQSIFKKAYWTLAAGGLFYVIFVCAMTYPVVQRLYDFHILDWGSD